jgi:hypothetical protein
METMNENAKSIFRLAGIAAVLVCLAPAPEAHAKSVTLTDAQVDNLVRRSYQYVAMYNVIHKFAIKFGNRWNACVADTQLKDHTTREIARPKNDTLYISCLLDVRKDPLVLEMPAFDSKYASLMITAYDHYVNIPMATSLGDFGKPEKMLIYSARTEGYSGKPVKGVDRLFEATGDFVSVVFRVMPHAVTAKDVSVGEFWSITVYNADGYLEANDLNRNSYNNVTAEKSDDGSITIHFGGCSDGRINCIPITPGWNYAIRMYEPHKEILDGSWTFPSIEPLK